MTTASSNNEPKKKAARFYQLGMGTLPDALYREDVPIDKWLDRAEATTDPNGFPVGSLNTLQEDGLDPIVEQERIFGIALWMVANVFPFAAVLLGGARFVWPPAGYALGGLCAYTGSLYAIVQFYYKPIFLDRYGRDQQGPINERLSSGGVGSNNNNKATPKEIRENQYLYTERNTSKYLNTRLVWPASLQRPSPYDDQPLVFCVIPHGAAPLGATSYPMWSRIWSSRLCRWTCAPIVLKIPLVGRFMQKIGYIEAKSKPMLETLEQGDSVGVFLDGIAGMFPGGAPGEEKAVLAARKGIAKIALRAGAPIVPVYAFGHTACWTVLTDPFGILEGLSVALQTALVLFFGRYGWFLGPPRRIPVALCLGEPILPPGEGGPIANPTKEQVTEHHRKMVEGFKEVFDLHKAAYGWPDKELKVV